MGILIKIILILVVLSWLFRMVMGYFARTFLSNFTNGQTPKTKEKSRKQGDVHIDKQPSKEKKIKDDVGEYVDYEEIK
jgi:hypothetical protein